MTLSDYLATSRRELDQAYGALTPIKAQPEAKQARQALIRAKNAIESARILVAQAQPLPTPAPVVKRIKGAMVVNAGNCSPELLRRAGITHVAVELNNANASDFATSRWDGFTKGWLLISRGNDGDTLANKVSPIVSFAIVDTESHKADMGGNLAWTETLYAALRSKLGLGYPLYNITFGIHSSPAVVNHDALRRHNVRAIWEAYDGAGVTLGVHATAAKALREGWNSPHVAIGDKSVAADVAVINALDLVLGDVWCWAPEQAGETILELAKVPA